MAHLFIFLLAALPTFAQDTCTHATLSNGCEAFKDLPEIIETKTGAYPNPLKASGRRLPKKYRLSEAAAKAKYDRLFNYARESLLGIISQGKSYPSLSDAQKAMHDKISTLTAFPMGGGNCGKGPNGSYDMVNHGFNICADTLDLPDAAALKLIAHELAHSIDPCNCQYPTLHVDKKKLRALKNSPEFASEVEADPGRDKVFGALDSAADTTGYTSTNIWNRVTPTSFLWYAKKGIVSVKAKPIPDSEYPLASTYRCLVEQDEIVEMTDARVEKWLKTPQEMPVTDQQREDVRRVHSKFPQCPLPRRGAPNTQMLEGMSDVWAAKVVGKYLTENPIGKDAPIAEKLAPFGGYWIDMCAPEKNVNENKPDMFGVHKHPDAKVRVDRLLLGSPEIASAVGCAPQARAGCVQRLDRDLSGAGGGRPVREAPETVD